MFWYHMNRFSTLSVVKQIYTTHTFLKWYGSNLDTYDYFINGIKDLVIIYPYSHQQLVLLIFKIFFDRTSIVKSLNGIK